MYLGRTLHRQRPLLRQPRSEPALEPPEPTGLTSYQEEACCYVTASDGENSTLIEGPMLRSEADAYALELEPPAGLVWRVIENAARAELYWTRQQERAARERES
jgi:hypothetical protein